VSSIESRSTDLLTAPVRLCCGQRHFGPICPDGLVMCCICFKRVRQEDLNTTTDGKKEDVCLKCAETERTANNQAQFRAK